MGNHTSDCQHEITVLVLIYNSSFERIKKTLISILDQEKVDIQIVIADDGSNDNHKEEIEILFGNYRFSNYKLVLNEENHGTVYNYVTGVNASEGKYLKAISPGDYFHDNLVLREWIDFLKQSGAEWSFSDAICYDSKTKAAISVKAHPDNTKVYSTGSSLEKRWNYIVVQDLPLGATILSTKDIQLQYLPQIANAGIIYGEDNMWRLMMFDGIDCSYYEKPTIYYEYGEGISTTKNRIWYDRITNDYQIANKMMAATPEPDVFQKKMIVNTDPQRPLAKKILTKGLLAYRIKRKINPRRTTTE